uniref:Uncharacterized protein n=1 Tax=Acrobeloides nanus TaxID=290746 RepID=A0A914EB41_9BILA
MNLNLSCSSSAAYLKGLERLKKEPKKEAEKKSNSKTPTQNYGRLKTKAMLNGFVSKYQNRRSQLVKCVNPKRTPVEVSRIHTKKIVWDGKDCFRIGDIIAIKNSLDMKDYFAQISNLATDQHAKNYAFLIWLVPQETAVDRHTFDPKHFEHGWGDEHPYPVEVIKFVMSCPPLPNYARKWTPEDLVREKIRNDLCSRIEALQKAATQEMASLKNDFKQKTI